MTNGPTHTQPPNGVIARVTQIPPRLLPTNDPSRDPVQWPEYREHSLFEQAVREAARTLNVPYSMAMMCAFGAMATACQRLVDVQMPHAHSPTITALMLLTLADSGTGKSRTESYFFEVIRAHNERLLADDQEAQKAYESTWKTWQNKLKALEKAHRKSIDSVDPASEQAAEDALSAHRASEPTAPQPRRFLYDDTTSQGLLKALHANSPYACLLTSEASSFLGGQAVQAFDKFNTLWSGDPVTVDRATGQSFTLPRTRLTLALMTQPSVITQFLKKHGAQARGTGFLARLLVVRPSIPARQTVRPLPLERPRQAAFQSRLRSLLEQPLPSQPQVLRFSEAAVDFWDECEAFIQRKMQEFGLYAFHKDHAARLLENTARLAAILHAFERTSEDDSEIDVATLRFCWAFVQSCSQHFLRSLAEEPPLISDTNRLVDYMLTLPDYHDRHAKGTQRCFTLSDLQRYGPNCLRGPANTERLYAAINLLIRLGHIEGNNGRRPYYRFSARCLTHAPELRNGEQVTLKTLPTYKSQMEARR